MLRYEHGGDIWGNTTVRLDFSVNLNPLGMPGKVKQAITEHIEEYQAYPDIYCRRLRQAIAAHEGVLPEEVICGNGASDLICRICLAVKPKRTLLTAPTFSEYERAALLAGSRIYHHRLKEEQQFTLTEAVLDDITPDSDLLFLCNPNNPTGQLISPSLMERIAARCEKTGTRLVVDECFLAFTDGISCKALLSKYPHTAILDAFTKRYAMAGLRLGYMISKDHGLTEAVRQAGALWNVSAVAEAAGIAALSCAGHTERARSLIVTEREYLSSALHGLGLVVYPGSANYILFRCKKELKRPLLERGILIRSCANYEGLDNSFYRISVMRREQNDILMAALREVLHG